jgi:hypothetical protein
MYCFWRKKRSSPRSNRSLDYGERNNRAYRPGNFSTALRFSTRSRDSKVNKR